MENNSKKEDFNEQYFLKIIESFESVKDIESKINDLNKMYIPISNVKDRNIIKTLFFKYLFISFYKNKNVNLVKELNNLLEKHKTDKNNVIFTQEYIQDINIIKKEKLTIEDFYIKTDKETVLTIEDNCFFANCETGKIEIIEDNKNIYTTNDLIDVFENDASNIRDNMTIVDNLLNLLNKKFENIDILSEKIKEIFDKSFIIPITTEFKIQNNQNKIKNVEGVNKIDTILNDFYKHIESTNQTEDFLINQMDLLNVIDKYEKMDNKTLANNIKILKQIFDSEYINYSSNPKSISFNSDKQLLSLRKSKIVINDKLTNSINKDIFRICTKDTNIFISGLCFINDKEDVLIKNFESLQEYLKNYKIPKIENNDIDTLLKLLKFKKVFFAIYLFSSDPYIDINKLIDILLKDKEDFITNENKASRDIKENIDKNELVMYGYNENKINLPVFKVEKLNSDKEDDLENKNLVCQHIIDKRELELLKKQKKLIQYENLSYRFIKKYITQDFNGNQICKSCSEKINIKGLSSNLDNIAPGGSSLINYNNLENMQEYSRFGKTQTSDGLINNMETLIIDFGNILNILSYSGFSFQQINVRKKLIKETIDVIINTRKTLYKEFKDIKEFIPSIIKKYNLNTKYCDYFIFELNNKIYETTSKDVQQKRKRNNIVYYILFNFLLNLTKQNFIDSLNKKVPLLKNFKNIYEEYKKNKDNIFKNIKISYNNEKVDILKFNVLCFYLYVISRILSQEKYKNKIILSTDIKYKVISIEVQLYIIYSLITLLDTVIDCAEFIKRNKGNQKITNNEIQYWEILKNKYDYQMNNIFSDQSLINDFYYVETETVKNTKQIVRFEHLENIKDNSFLFGFSNDPQNNMDGRITLSYINFKHNNQDNQNHSYNQSENQTDLFHEFIYDSNIKELKCKICGLPFSKITYKDKNIKKSKEDLFNEYMNKRLNIYCPNGIIHNFESGKCKFCGYVQDSKDNKNIKKLYNSLSTGIIIKSKDNLQFKEKFKLQIEVQSRNKRNKQTNGIIKTIINTLKNNFGQNINIDNQLLEFENNTYSLSYDYKNNAVDNKRKVEIEKVKTENKKYYLLKSGNVRICYDYYTLLPYSYEINKNTTNIKANYNQSLNINYSLTNIIKLLFNDNRFIIFNNIGDVYKYIDSYNKSYKWFKQLLTIYIQKINNKIKYVEPEKTDKKDKIDILELNNLMFDIRKFYDKFKIDNNLFSDIPLIYDDKLDFIEYDKIYDVVKINGFINSINIKINYFIKDLKNIISKNNQSFNEFIINFIYYYFINYSKMTDKNKYIMFDRVINSKNITLLDKTIINESKFVDDQVLKELEDKLKIRELNKELEKNDDETLDIDHDVENEDDIEYEDNND